MLIRGAKNQEPSWSYNVENICGSQQVEVMKAKPRGGMSKPIQCSILILFSVMKGKKWMPSTPLTASPCVINKCHN